MPSFLRMLLTPATRRSLTRSFLIVLALCTVWIGLNAGNLRELLSARHVLQSEEHQWRQAQKRVDQLKSEKDKSSDFDSEKRIRCANRMVKRDEKVIYFGPKPQ
jgi:hypothetical protein